VQRQDPEGIVILCDFCRRDWDGQEPMIEGHHGSVLCLQCLQQALVEQAPGPDKFKCTLCLRFNIPPEMPRWRHPGNPEAVVCQECMYQAARAFHRNKDVPFQWDPSQYPPAVKPAPQQPHEAAKES
jgi:hypothetical protein